MSKWSAIALGMETITMACQLKAKRWVYPRIWRISTLCFHGLWWQKTQDLKWCYSAMSQGRAPMSKVLQSSVCLSPSPLIPAVLLVLANVHTLHSDEQWSPSESVISLVSTLRQVSWPVIIFWYPLVSHFKTVSLFTMILSLKLLDLSIALSLSYGYFWRLQTSYNRVFASKWSLLWEACYSMTGDLA